MFHRNLNISKSNSFILLGPRGTGKSTYIRELLPTCFEVDLLDASTARLLLNNPSRLLEMVDELPERTEWVFIDEVQKIPELLDLVHLLIERKKLKFALSGSSARKLKRGGANLLAGRAFVHYLFPLTSIELGTSFSLEHALHWGTLPKLTSLTSDSDKIRFLDSYVHTYLKEEILEEQLIRKLEPFNRFLEVAAQCNGDVINYSRVANDIDSDPNTVRSYYEILEDTLIGLRLPAFHRSLRKRQGGKPKFYLFDLGVKRSLDNSLRSTLPIGGNDFGKLFESFIINEFFRLNSYYDCGYKFSYLRVDENQEIDLIIDTPNKETILVEIKSVSDIKERHLSSLLHFGDDFKDSKKFCLSTDPNPRQSEGVHILPWQEGIRRIFRISS